MKRLLTMLVLTMAIPSLVYAQEDNESFGELSNITKTGLRQSILIAERVLSVPENEIHPLFIGTSYRQLSKDVVDWVYAWPENGIGHREIIAYGHPNGYSLWYENDGLHKNVVIRRIGVRHERDVAALCAFLGECGYLSREHPYQTSSFSCVKKSTVKGRVFSVGVHWETREWHSEFGRHIITIFMRLVPGEIMEEDYLENVKSTQNSGDAGSSGFSLAGRYIVGSLPTPAYNVQIEGRVVIRITVNAEGAVTSAVYEQAGSTTNHGDLVSAARTAALRAQFTQSEAEMQTGTITYIFRLN